MIHINAIQRIPEDLNEVQKPLRLDLSLEASSSKELTESLLLLAKSIDQIMACVEEPSGLST